MTTAESEDSTQENTPAADGATDEQSQAVDPAAVAAGTACANCGGALSNDQGWCLQCGTAVAPRRRRLGALRRAGLAGALAVALTAGGVAVSYAALSDKPPSRATKVETVATAAPAPAPEPAPAVEDVQPLPPVEDTQPIEPVTPVTPAPVKPVTPVATTPPATVPTTKTKTKTKTKTVAKAKEPELKPIVFGAGAGSLYDPGKRATATGDPQRAIDGNPATSWFATTAAEAEMNVGYLLDLGESMEVRRLELVTKTQGFTLEVLGARGGKAPKTVDAPEWTVLGAAGNVDSPPVDGFPESPIRRAVGDKPDDRHLTLELSKATGIYRHIVLWVSAPPRLGPTVRFSSIRLLQ